MCCDIQHTAIKAKLQQPVKLCRVVVGGLGLDSGGLCIDQIWQW